MDNQSEQYVEVSESKPKFVLIVLAILFSVGIFYILGLNFQGKPLPFSKATPHKQAKRVVAAPSKLPADPDGLNLSGISLMDDDYLAIINGNILKAGDHVNGYSVVQIDESVVTLEKESDHSSKLLQLHSDKEQAQLKAAQAQVN